MRSDALKLGCVSATAARPALELAATAPAASLVPAPSLGALDCCCSGMEGMALSLRTLGDLRACSSWSAVGTLSRRWAETSDTNYLDGRSLQQQQMVTNTEPVVRIFSWHRFLPQLQSMPGRLAYNSCLSRRTRMQPTPSSTPAAFTRSRSLEALECQHL